MKIVKAHSVAQIYSFQNLNLAQRLLSHVDELALGWSPAKRYTDSTVANQVSDIEQNDLFLETKNWFQTCLRRVAYTDMPAQYQLAVSDLWLTRTEQSAVTHRHKHPLSVYSGIFYLQDSQQGTNFALTSWHFDHWPQMFSMAHPPRSQTWQQPCTQGTLVIFPSYIEHWVERQTAPDVRYTLAWNSFWHGELNASLGTRLRIQTSSPG